MNLFREVSITVTYEKRAKTVDQVNDKGGNTSEVRAQNTPDTNKSEYRRLAMAVIHLGVWIRPSVAECTSLNPCASA